MDTSDSSTPLLQTSDHRVDEQGDMGDAGDENPEAARVSRILLREGVRSGTQGPGSSAACGEAFRRSRCDELERALGREHAGHPRIHTLSQPALAGWRPGPPLLPNELTRTAAGRGEGRIGGARVRALVCGPAWAECAAVLVVGRAAYFASLFRGVLLWCVRHCQRAHERGKRRQQWEAR